MNNRTEWNVLVTGAQLAAWLNNQTGYKPLELEPIETREQRNARLIATANRRPLPAAWVPVIAARLTN